MRRARIPERLRHRILHIRRIPENHGEKKGRRFLTAICVERVLYGKTYTLHRGESSLGNFKRGAFCKSGVVYPVFGGDRRRILPCLKLFARNAAEKGYPIPDLQLHFRPGDIEQTRLSEDFLSVYAYIFKLHGISSLCQGEKSPFIAVRRVGDPAFYVAGILAGRKECGK